jgi:hypothetical protein
MDVNGIVKALMIVTNAEDEADGSGGAVGLVGL